MLQFYTVDSSTLSFLNRSNSFIYEDRWQLKQVRGSTSGKFSTKRVVVEYVYKRSKVKITNVGFQIDRNKQVVLLETTKVKGNGKGRNRTLTGRIAKIMSGKLIYGRVKDPEIKKI